MPNEPRRHTGGARQGHQRGHRGYPQPRRTLDTHAIRFQKDESGKLDPELFNSLAQQVAKEIAEARNTNKPTQIRRFYDEIVMWEEKVRQHPERFDEYLPYIRMLNAKAAYAEGRKLVDGAFVDLMSHCVKQVGKVEEMQVFKLFFEAFMGFYKLERPRD